MDVANFLASLASEGLLAATIKTYRSAILTSLKQLGGRVRRSADRPSLISDVLKGISARDARNPRRIPLWDLFLVLDALRNPPFEPLAQVSRKWLTLKTVFLVALACGRRSSGVHGLSGLRSDISREADGGFSLRFLPDFLAKNQRSSDLSPVLALPPLTSILPPGDSDCFLCPVRALSHYLSVTRADRSPGQRRIFISINAEYKKDISVSTISRWISEVVRVAYDASAKTAPSTRAHELRALSSSVALAHSIPLHQILESAFWRSENTFINFYLRQSARLREDGSCGVASLVASQCVISRKT